MVEGAEDLTSSGLEGQRFGRYLLRHRIARGGMASIYLAQLSGAHGFEKWVALKVVHPHLAEDRRFVQMFLDEARLASRIHHPNVCQVLGERITGTDDGERVTGRGTDDGERITGTGTEDGERVERAGTEDGERVDSAGADTPVLQLGEQLVGVPPERHGRTRARERPSATRREAAEPAEDTAADRSEGTLNLLAIPSAEVTLGGRSLGRTPLVNRTLPAGQHVLTLAPVVGGPTKRIVVRIRPGENTRTSVTLSP